MQQVNKFDNHRCMQNSARHTHMCFLLMSGREDLLGGGWRVLGDLLNVEYINYDTSLILFTRLFSYHAGNLIMRSDSLCLITISAKKHILDCYMYIVM